MPNTYSKLYTQVIFCVKGRSNFIQNEWRDELYKYISGIVDGKSQKLVILFQIDPLFCFKLTPHSDDVDPGVTMRQTGILTPNL